MIWRQRGNNTFDMIKLVQTSESISNQVNIEEVDNFLHIDHDHSSSYWPWSFSQIPGSSVGNMNNILQCLEVNKLPDAESHAYGTDNVLGM